MYIIRYGGKNNKIIWKLSNYLRYFPKKIIFFKNFGGAQAPLGHQMAPPLQGWGFTLSLKDQSSRLAPIHLLKIDIIWKK